MRRWGAPAIVTLAAMAALTALTADAAARQARPKAPTEATAPRDAGEPIMAIVSIKTQQVTFYDADGWIMRAPVSTGTTGRETPAGVFAILEKNKDHRSSLYDDAEMPNMQRITWNGIALHGGPLPGYAASHGCMRMPFGFAEKLFDRTRIGMRVIVSPDNAEPVEFSHPALLVPKRGGHRGRAGQGRGARPRGGRGRQDGRRGEESRRDSGARDGVADGVAAQAGGAQDPRRRRARLRRQGARRRQDGRGQGAGRGPQAKGRRQGRGTGDAARHRQGRREIEARRRRRRKGSRQGGRRRRKADTAKAASEAKLALEPVSIYISRATQKLYVRRPTHKPAPDGGGIVFDATIEVPVTIRNPERPIGTHVFTAVARNEAGLRWTAVTIEDGDNAKAALDRITIPQEVLDRIAPTALPRSSIVVSDEPLSSETNYRTEFVAVLSSQPQGGFITRRPTRRCPHCERRRPGRQRLRLLLSSAIRPPKPAMRAARGGQYYRPVQPGWWQ